VAESKLRLKPDAVLLLLLLLTTAVTQVVMIRAGSLSVGVPANVVETVRRTTAAELKQAYKTGTRSGR
jgi:chemosensory pili system protein ChpA (sensor histidine kinase/response regulator)